MKDLKQCRDEIDAIDEQLMKLFEQRMSIAKDVVTYKLENNMTIFQSDREKEVVEKNINRMKQDVLKPYGELFIQDMMNLSKSYQTTFIPRHSIELHDPQIKGITVGYPGVQGSFSEEALNAYFSKETPRKNYQTFNEVFEALKNDEIRYGIVPLENSSTGAINDNYDAIRDYGFYIVGEQSISIAQHLLGTKDACLDDITDVYSHPQGLLQSSSFLHAHPHIHTHEYDNTAIAAQYVASENNKHLGAIASMQAASVYNLKVIQENVHDNSLNETRFIIFSKYLEKVENASCVSLVFTLKHQTGALYQVMKTINDHQMNMLRIESRPLLETPWEYYFYVDIEGQLDNPRIIQAIEDMKAHTLTLRILGQYCKSEKS